MSNDERSNYSYDYWFNNSHHAEWDYGGEDYYVNRFYEDIVFNLDLPEDGYIVVLGTYKCVSFDKLCKKYGYERCVGMDLWNPEGHPRVIVKDCSTLSEEDNMPIAFCHNDLGGFGHTPKLKMHGQNWAIKNMVPGSYFLGNDSSNRLGIDIESLMEENGMTNTHLRDLDPTKFNLTNLSSRCLNGYMLSYKAK